MDTPTCVTHLRSVLKRLEVQREAAMLDRRLSRADQRDELNRLLAEQSAISYAIGLIEQREVMEGDGKRHTIGADDLKRPGLDEAIDNSPNSG